MTTQTDPATAVQLPRDGERLDREMFHERYRHAPPGFKAELIGGVVHVAAAMKTPHGEHHALVIGWLVFYAASTPCVRCRDNTTVILDDDNEPQPDAALVIDAEYGGQSTVNEDDYVEGAPELVVEVADSSTHLDVREKLALYESGGVGEYIVVAIPQRKVRWFVLGEDGYEEQSPVEGVLTSPHFPGLRLNVDALLSLDAAAVLATLNEGLADPAHATFVRDMRKKRRP